jgi:hypothetical protein
VARIENLHRMPQQTADAIDISSAEPLVLEKS